MSDDPFLRDDDDKEGFNPEEFEFEDDAEFFPQYYDLEKVFDECIHPLLKSIVNICTEYDIPMVTTFQYANSKSNVMLCTSVINPPKRTAKKLIKAAKVLLE